MLENFPEDSDVVAALSPRAVGFEDKSKKGNFEVAKMKYSAAESRLSPYS